MQPEVQVISGEAFAWVHDCDAMCGDGVRRMFEARYLNLDSRWQVRGPDERATLDPSLVCTACGLHGFWRDGKWSA